MTMRHILLGAMLLSTPALADTVMLQIENDAGMVTTRDGYTQTECDAAALLLNGSKPDVGISSSLLYGTCGFNCVTTSGTGAFISSSALSVPRTSKLTKAQCMRPTQGTKP